MSSPPSNARDTGRSVDAGVPLHRQLFLVLYDEISRGSLAQGAPLPTEQSLCEQFNVSRITVRRALNDLAEQGYIERRRGVGSFVRQIGTGEPHFSDGAYIDGLRQVQFETDVEVLELDHRRLPTAVRRRFSGDDDPTLHVLRVRRERRTAEPLIVTEAWLPDDLSETVTHEALESTALYDLMSESGLAFDRMEHELSAEIAGPLNAKHLDVPIGSALIRVDRLAFIGELPHHYLSILLSPSRSRVLINPRSADPNAGDRVTIAHDVWRRDRH